MLDRKHLAGDAAYEALKLRRNLAFSLEEAVSPIDAAERLGIEVRLIDLPSMEGIYVAGNAPTIMLSSLRPQGRRHFTCAHEIGHHLYGHGQQFDEIHGQRNARREVDPKEFIADCFSSYFLMPKATIESGMHKRNFRYSSLTHRQAFTMASWLGVGYETFVNHAQYGIRAISNVQGNELRKWAPSDVRTEFTGLPLAFNLHIVDHSWVGRAVDCEVGDNLLIPDGSLLEGDLFDSAKTLRAGILVSVKTPGIGKVSSGSPPWSVFVRACRSRYTGRACFRFDEECEE